MLWMWCVAMDAMQCMRWMWCDGWDAIQYNGCNAIGVMRWMCWDAMWCDRYDAMHGCEAMLCYGSMHANAMVVMWCDGCCLRCDRCDIMLWIYHITHHIHRNACIHRIHSMESHRIHRITSHSSHRIHIINHIHRITPPTLLVNLLTYHVHFYNTFVFFTLFDEKELLYIKILTVINFRFYHYHLKK